MYKAMKIISGAQTGVDQAALTWALHFCIPHGGFCPKGRLSEAGPIPSTFTNLVETASSQYPVRTEANVLVADYTILIKPTPKYFSRGCALTERLSLRHNKPLLTFYADNLEQAGASFGNPGVIKDSTFNVAGPSGSKWQDSAYFTWAILNDLFEPGGDRADISGEELCNRCGRSAEQYYSEEFSRFISYGLSHKRLISLVSERWAETGL